MSNHVKYFLYRMLLALISAILLSLAFSSFNLGFLAYFALVPLFFTLRSKSGMARAFLISYFCGFVFFLTSMYWLIHVTYAGWVLLSLYQAFYFGIFGLFFCYITKLSNETPSIFDYIAIPSMWVVLEFIRGNFLGGIGWNLIGYSQYKNLPIIQIADITGVWGVSFLVVIINVAVYSTTKMAIKCYKLDPKLKIKGKLPFSKEIKINPVVQTFFVLVLIAVTLVYGYISLTKTEESSSLKISIVQGNIPQTRKWDKEFKIGIMQRYEDLTMKAAETNPDIIIWPETAVPGYLNADESLVKWIKRVAKKAKTFLLVGAPIVNQKNNKKSYNSAILFSKKGKILQKHDKLHLVLLGEYIPFEDRFPFLRKIFPITGNYTPGEEYTVFKLPITNHSPITNFSVLICFEDIFPSLVRKFVKGGADFIVNITNDAWFHKTSAAYQHASCSVFRAVENRRPFIRSANTGLSCFVDKKGKIYGRVTSGERDLFVEGINTSFLKIDKNKDFTPYTKFGDVFVLMCAFIILTFICKLSLTRKM